MQSNVFSMDISLSALSVYLDLFCLFILLINLDYELIENRIPLVKFFGIYIKKRDGLWVGAPDCGVLQNRQ